MVKRDTSLRMNIRQYLISARKFPTENDKEPAVFSMRIFAANEVLAKTKFWRQMRRQNKFKKANGEILAVNEIHERNPRRVKTYGIVARYQSRTGIHNMYREYRDLTLNGAIGQLYTDMSGRHRAPHATIEIVRTAIINKASEIRRDNIRQFYNSRIKFPLLRKILRTSNRSYRNDFATSRPSTHHS
eukprot:TRINITY_DN0_c4061_g1_i2.p1 TRINITY_DN0_c4061_g1~~TRINITY_DN0_c4061_g1_i2.p1  ORF type:complete len:187 (-),score=53.89 TRINITY_DN0_c4061_g1_i2:20-580(-)